MLDVNRAVTAGISHNMISLGIFLMRSLVNQHACMYRAVHITVRMLADHTFGKMRTISSRTAVAALLSFCIAANAARKRVLCRSCAKVGYGKRSLMVAGYAAVRFIAGRDVGLIIV